ncbi:PfkB family carbohydrate kinase, partial [Streptantibioticus rubrisoli]
MGKRPLVVVGDALLDRDIDGQASRLAPDAPVPVVDVHGVHERPGGAGLAAALAAREGREVVLVTALGDGDADQAVRGLLTDRVHMVAFARHGTVPVKTRLRAGGRPLVRLDDGGGPVGAPTPAVRRVLADAAAVLVCDYGQGTAGAVRAMLAQAARRVPVVWDPHPRGGAPVAGVRLAVPNAGEARVFAGHLAAGSGGSVLRQCAERAAALCGHWQAAAVVITLGERGALLSRGSASPMLVPARRRVAGDPCGAGDCFAATAAGALADGGLIEEAVQCAVRAATDFVAHGGAGNPTCWHPARPASSQPAPDPADPFALARS